LREDDIDVMMMMMMMMMRFFFVFGVVSQCFGRCWNDGNWFRAVDVLTVQYYLFSYTHPLLKQEWDATW
jgi:hypothetical protein